MKKAVAIYALVVGILMVCMWVFFIVSGNVHEFESKPWEIICHLIAEFATAILLIAAAVVEFKKIRLGKPLLLAGFGMLLYTVIVSPGYYAQRGEIPFVLMFFVLAILTIISICFITSSITKEQRIK